MIPVLTADQIRETDSFTITNEPIASIDLMERASIAFVKRFEELANHSKPILVFAGTGNNGGDALAVARLLRRKGRDPKVFIVGDPSKGTPDFIQNRERLSQSNVSYIKEESQIPSLNGDEIVIDGLFGSGLSRPIAGVFAEVIEAINASEAEIYSIDIASGLYCDREPDGPCIRPQCTISFQVPKLVFFLPSLHPFVGDAHLVDIGLDGQFIENQDSRHYLTDEADILGRLKSRSKFIHKGEAGRLTLVGGSKGRIGACVLAARAALRSGVGLLQVHAPEIGYEILQVAVPEAMVGVDIGREHCIDFNLIKEDQTVTIGPGLGTNDATLVAFEKFLDRWEKPIVVDADGINLISRKKKLLEKLPKDSILTPHPGEFERLVGSWKDDFEKLTRLSDLAKEYHLNIVLKGAFSAVCSTQGVIFYNPTGNPGMATAGSGDVLAGVIGGLLAQGYLPEDALKIGVYVHGLSGDLSLAQGSEYSLIASDLVDNLGKSLKQLFDKKQLLR